MTIRTPALGDRVQFFYGVMHGEKYGKVIARRESAWGKTWEVQMDEEAAHIEHITSYTGTAEDRGDYAVRRGPDVIGTYLVCSEEEARKVETEPSLLEPAKFTKTATVKYLNTDVGFVVLSYAVDGKGDGFDGHVQYSSAQERCDILNSADADLTGDGLQLVFEHRQKVGLDTQTVRLYVQGV